MSRKPRPGEWVKGGGRAPAEKVQASETTKQDIRAQADAVIFDLDGTLASCEWRKHHIESAERAERNWQAFFDGIPADAPVEEIVERLRSVPEGVRRIIVTGRPDEFEYQTRWHLAEHEIPYDELHMRPRKDQRPDYEVKRDVYEQFIAPRFKVLEVFEDKEDVADMWESEGLKVNRVVDPNLPPVYWEEPSNEN